MGQIACLKLTASGTETVPNEATSLDELSAALPAGVYTTFRTYPGERALRLGAHLARLRDSAALEGHPIDLDDDVLRCAVVDGLTSGGFMLSRVRITIGLGSPIEVYISVAKYVELPAELYEAGIDCALGDRSLKRELPKSKATRFIAPAMAAREANPDTREVLLVDASGAILEGSSSNFFAILSGSLRTAEAGVLAGVTRGIVLSAAGSLPIDLRPVHVDEIPRIEEAFITSVSRAILPVVSIAGTTIGDGRPGARTRSLMNAFSALVRLKRQKPERLGHPWVFAGEIAHIPELIADGDIVRVLDVAGGLLGSAYINRRSKITLRYLTRNDEAIDGQWWYDHLAAAIDRRAWLPDVDGTNAVRLINAEADGLPGLIGDQYSDVLVVQFLALGLEPWRELLIEALVDLTRPTAIWERSDVSVRELEGLEQRSGLLAGREPPPLVEVFERDARLLVDIRAGQKTGMFLDQRRNRVAAATYARGARVLNCFAYSGAFGVHAGLAGATDVVNVDISGAACDLANRNMALNGLSERHQSIVANCFDLLRELSDRETRFDVVILDPPAFTKSRSTVDGAIRGYKEINLRAMRLLDSGGILVTCSCSQHIDDYLFKQMLGDAARDAHKYLRIFEQRGQGPDHPVLLSAPETQYLICVIAEVY